MMMMIIAAGPVLAGPSYPTYNCPTAYTCGAQARHGLSQAGREQHTIEVFFITCTQNRKRALEQPR